MQVKAPTQDKNTLKKTRKDMIEYSERSNEELKQIVMMDYRKILRKYYQRIGNYSYIANELITPSLIATVEKRYIELGGNIEMLYAAHRKKNRKMSKV